MDLLDITGATLSLIATVLFVKASPKAWPVSLIAILLNTKLYFDKEIIGQALLELYYLFSCMYGWINWSSLKENKPLAISYMPTKHYAWLVTSVVCLFASSLWLLSSWQSVSPKMDALIVSISIIAQFLLCRKIIECWILWFIADLAIACLHFDKGLVFHSIQHFAYLALAVSGYINWYRHYHASYKDKLAFS